MNELDKSILEFIKEYGIEHGYLPTVRDISAGLNISQARAFKRFKTLEERGMIFREGQKYRVKGLKYIREEKVIPVSVLDKIKEEVAQLTEIEPDQVWNVQVFEIIEKYRGGEEG